MTIQVDTKCMMGFGDTFRVNDQSDDESFILSFECGEFFGQNDIKVKVLQGRTGNRLVIEGTKAQGINGVSVSRRISYEHDLPDGIETVHAEWDPNDEVLIVSSPFNRTE